MELKKYINYGVWLLGGIAIALGYAIAYGDQDLSCKQANHKHDSQPVIEVLQ